jgi:hypothetical protein
MPTNITVNVTALPSQLAIIAFCASRAFLQQNTRCAINWSVPKMPMLPSVVPNAAAITV